VVFAIDVRDSGAVTVPSPPLLVSWLAVARSLFALRLELAVRYIDMKQVGGREQSSHGGILIMTMVFISMFLVIFVALSGLLNRSYHESVLQAQDELAFQIAEAGLNYARWRLAHDPTNFDEETKNVTDQFAGTVGSYELTFDTPVPGSTVVVITSVGQTAAQPSRNITLQARYGIPSLARYAYITNSDVYYAAEIHGVIHANGGVRMDGQSDSIVQSAQATYLCKPIHGCNPQQTRPGVWGTGQIQSLWEFPVAPVDYASLTQDLANMKTAAQASNTYYGQSGAFGYQIVFNANSTYSIYRVTQKTAAINSCDYDANGTWSCGNFSHDVQTQVLLETKAVPAGGVIYTEDTLWVRGDIRGAVTVAAGRFPDSPATNVDIIVNGNISYGGVHDGSRVFGAIAQRHLLIPYSGAPATLTLEGAFMAQKGKFGRRYYNSGSHRLKTSITVYGMVGSNQVPGTSWVSGGTVVSGYQQKVQTYDANLLYGPPPYFPTNGQYEFISWEQVQ
jgi:Tfp pilus assembly protein PilX